MQVSSIRCCYVLVFAHYLHALFVSWQPMSLQPTSEPRELLFRFRLFIVVNRSTSLLPHLPTHGFSHYSLFPFMFPSCYSSLLHGVEPLLPLCRVLHVPPYPHTPEPHSPPPITFQQCTAYCFINLIEMAVRQGSYTSSRQFNFHWKYCVRGYP